jgi:hypothetical protein
MNSKKNIEPLPTLQSFLIIIKQFNQDIAMRKLFNPDGKFTLTNRAAVFYVLIIYLIFFCFDLFLDNAYGGPLQAQGGFPSIRSTEAPRQVEPRKSCREFLTICEKSCINREGIFRFTCLGPDFNTSFELNRCQCGDEAFVPHVVHVDSPKMTEKQETK